MKTYVLFGMMLAVFVANAQIQKKTGGSNLQRSINRSAEKLTDALEQSASDEVVADEYKVLAKQLSDQGDYVRAEDYLKRAIHLYLKLEKNDLASTAYRELAKLLEWQNRWDDAIANYRNAARYAQDDVRKKLNENDANRLGVPADLAAQSAYVRKNIDLSAATNTLTEQIDAYRQMAEIKRGQQDNRGALEELEKALAESEASEETKDASFQIKQEMAQTLAMDNKYEEAIELNKQLVDDVRRKNNYKAEINQLQNLAVSYFDAGESSEGIVSLQEAYQTALAQGLMLDAKDILEQIVEYYLQESKTSQALDAYSGFIGQLETLVKNDSTLIDEKFFQLLEDKITRLEKERTLKDELITKKNRFNNVLLGSIVLILLSLSVIIKMLFDNLLKNKKIALQSLRREMNPHFIFNSLNSVNRFIAENNEREANKYLSSYSKLMRAMMENSNKDFISLSNELALLCDYLALEQLRFGDKFTFTIQVDESLDTDSLMIPNMLIQPHLENAIWHGLRYKDEAGVLSLTVCKENGFICVTVDDNGIGLKRSRELKTGHQKAQLSRGQTNTFERIDLLNRLYHTKIKMDIIDKNGASTGVIVKLRFPEMNNSIIPFHGKN